MLKDGTIWFILRKNKEDEGVAYENGNNAFDYCAGIFLSYKEDRLIFSKALQSLQFFQTRSDYPYCTKDMSEVLIRLIGCDFDTLANSVYKYTVLLGEDMCWEATKTLRTTEPIKGETDDSMYENLVEELSPEEGARLAEEFRNDLQAFLLTISPLLNDLIIGDSSMGGLQKIAVKETYSNEKVVRFIRCDDQFLDFSMGTEDIKTLCRTLSQIIKD